MNPKDPFKSGTGAAALVWSRAFPNLFALLRMIPRPRWAVLVLVPLGVLSSLAEMIGIILIPLFVYSMMNQLSSLAASGGALGIALRFAIGHFRSSREIALVFLLLIVLRGILAYAYSTTTSHISENISQITRERIHYLYLTLPYRFVQRHDQATLVQLLGEEVYLVAKAYTSLTRIFINSTFIVMLGIVLAVISWKIMFCVVLGSLLLSAVLRLLSYRASAIGTDVKRIHRDLWERMMITLQGMKIIRAYAQEDIHHRQFQVGSAEARNVILRELQLLLLLDPLTEVGYLIILGSIILGAQSLGINFGTTLTCVALLYRLQPHVRELEGHRLMLLQLEPQLASVRAVLEAEQQEHEPSGTLEISTIQRGIRFENVSFNYQPEATPTLHHLTFNIPAGKTTAIFGASGSGKTTIVNLLLRLYPPNGGLISVDGNPLQDLSRAQWLAMVGVAGQDVDLISGSVADNIRLADSHASQASIAAVAEAMGISEFLNSLPDRENTWVGQQEIRFSGGQRQRIGLARAVLRKPKLLILDEAMNAMDTALEQQIWRAIETRFAGCTILLITHRIETVLGVDNVICLADGCITGEGSPREMLRDPASTLSLALLAKEDAKRTTD